MCSKRPYWKLKDAETARNLRLNARNDRPDSLRIYHCGECSCYHLAHGRRTENDSYKRLPGERQTRRRRRD